MEPEKLLPVGETLQADVPAVPTPVPVVPVPVPAPTPALPGVPSAKQQSWGVVISIIIIVLMIIIGAFYAWGERIAEERALDIQSVTQ